MEVDLVVWAAEGKVWVAEAKAEVGMAAVAGLAAAAEKASAAAAAKPDRHARWLRQSVQSASPARGSAIWTCRPCAHRLD
jgi:hypothetical protein